MSIKRFNIKVSDEVLNNLKSRLKNVKWPDQLEDLGFERGTDLNYLKSLVSYWIEDFDCVHKKPN